MPGGPQSSQASWDPKGNDKRPTRACSHSLCVCLVPLLLQSLGGLRCSTVSGGFSHVTSDKYFRCNSKWHLHTPACERPLGYFPLLGLHVSSLPSKLEKSADNESPLTFQTMMEGNRAGCPHRRTRTTVKPDFARPLQHKEFTSPKKLDTPNHSPPRPPYLQGHPKALPSGFCLWKRLMRCGMPDPFRPHLWVGVCRHMEMPGWGQDSLLLQWFLHLIF